VSFYVVIKKQFVEGLELKEGSEFQGKYSMGSSLFPNNFNHTVHIACVSLIRIS
jgi:hypothetical protein